jgi:mono/diheme cytochrome c family protein
MSIMPNAAKAALLIAAALAIHTARAADPEAGIDPAVSVIAAAEPHIPPPALDGAQLFATHCAMCHKPAELARGLQGAADPKAARADMAAFLARHGRSDAAADAAIIDYLANSRPP